MKKVMTLVATVIILAGLTFAQGASGAAVGGAYVAANYFGWSVPVVVGTTSGSSNQTFTLASGYFTVAGGRQVPFSVNQVVTFSDSGAENGTISAVSSGCIAKGYNATNPCVITISSSLSNAHGQGSAITSGTFGLQEAINDAAQSSGGGLVVVDQAWKNLGGVSSTITGATGVSAVEIEDRRGNPFQIYQSGIGGGTTYSVAFAVGTTGASAKSGTNCGTSTTCLSSAVTPTFVFGTAAASAASTATVLGMPTATTRAICEVTDATNATSVKPTYSGTLLTLTTVATSSDTFNYNCQVF